MNAPTVAGAREPGSDGLQRLAILALGLATFSRLVEYVFGLPRAVDWLHFPLVSGLFALSLRRVDRDAAPVFVGCIVLLPVFALSGWLNGAGLVNVALGYILLAEPFLLLAIMVNGLPSPRTTKSMGWWLLSFAVIQIPVAIYQWSLTPNKPDLVQGTFRGMGAGHHVMGAITTVAALYLLSGFAMARWVRWGIAGLLFLLSVLSDSKQVMLTFVIAYVLVRVPNVKTGAAAAALAMRLALLVVLICVAIWAIEKDEYFYKVGFVLRASAGKFAIFSVLASHFDSAAQWVFGLGPGHGVSRLGGWLLERYWSVLEPLGATRTGIATVAWRDAHPFGLNSSFFAPLFSWAGIFGDVGLAGLGVYAALVGVTYRRFCRDEFSRLLVIAIVIFGFVFEWLEEYNFMLYAAAVIAQRWQAITSAAAATKRLPSGLV